MKRKFNLILLLILAVSVSAQSEEKIKVFDHGKVENNVYENSFFDLSYAGLTINQSYYSTIMNGFSLNAIISYVTEEQKDELQKILDLLKFNN